MRFIILGLLFSLSGCIPDKVSTSIIKIAESIIDGNISNQKFLLMYELTQNNKGRIYQLFYNNSPYFELTGEHPTIIHKYKDKYICIINPCTDVFISNEEINKITKNLSESNNSYIFENEMWYIAILNDGSKYSVVSTNKSNRLSGLPYHFPQLLKYMYEGFDECNIPKFIFEDYEWIVSDDYESKKTIKKHLIQMDGTIYFSNPNDIFFNVSKDENFIATINGNDTLKYYVSDTIHQRLFIDSISGSSFINNLPSNDTWHYLQHLIQDSTYYFQKINGHYSKTFIPYSNIPQQIYIKNTENKILDIISTKGRFNF